MKKTTSLFIIISCISIFWISCTKEDIQQPETTFTDSRDGEVYKTVTIGNQVWMAENLRYDTTASWFNLANPDPKYGRLYDWITALVVCPQDWRLPSDTDWKILELELGMSSIVVDSFGCCCSFCFSCLFPYTMGN